MCFRTECARGGVCPRAYSRGIAGVMASGSGAFAGAPPALPCQAMRWRRCTKCPRRLAAGVFLIVALKLAVDVKTGAAFAGHAGERQQRSVHKLPSRALAGTESKPFDFDFGAWFDQLSTQMGPSVEIVRQTYLTEVGKNLADWTAPLLALTIVAIIVLIRGSNKKMMGLGFQGEGDELDVDDDEEGAAGIFGGGGAAKPRLQITRWNRTVDSYKLAITKATMGAEEAAKMRKDMKEGYAKLQKATAAVAAAKVKEEDAQKKATTSSSSTSSAADTQKDKSGAEAEEVKTKRVWVLTFKGASANVGAAGVEQLREEITAVVAEADPEQDEVVLKLDSPGGTVTGYGLAGAQLMRLKSAGLRLTVAIDQVAASGGYLMACVADHIMCSPFAIIGSIGVVSELPVVYDRLKREGIQFETTTAGQFKRTLTPFKEPTDEDRKKTKEDIEDVFSVFKEFVHTSRPSVDIDTVATGETWLGPRALAKGLVDELKTSDDLLLEHVRQGSQVLIVKYGQPMGSPLQRALNGVADAATAFAGRVPAAVALLAGTDGAESAWPEARSSFGAAPMARGPSPRDGPWAQL